MAEFDRIAGCVVEGGCPAQRGLEDLPQEVVDIERPTLFVLNRQAAAKASTAGFCLESCGVAPAIPGAEPGSVSLEYALFASHRPGGLRG